MIFSKWKHASSVVRGNDHIENDMPCQDNVAYKIGNGVEIIALSDGAGSKPKSQIGSETATKAVCDYLVEDFDDLYVLSETYGKTEAEVEEQKRILKESIFNRVKKAMLEKLDGDMEFEDLACTLLFFARKDDKYIIGHIGDGVIGGLFNSGKNKVLRVLSIPENGAQINITFFLTDSDAIDHLRIVCGRYVNLCGVILMSDGPEEVLYHPVNGLHENCLKLFESFNSQTCEKYNTILEKFLSTKIAQYSYDDLSINMLYLASVDSKVEKKEVVDDMFKDIKNINQVIEKSSYGIFLDNSYTYKDVDDLSKIRGM